MNKETQREVVRVLVQAGRKDLAQHVTEVTADTLAEIMGNDLYKKLVNAYQDMQDDEQDVVGEAMSYFRKRFELDRDEKDAFSRLRDLGRISRMGPDMVRNNVGKIANSLGKKTKIKQLKFF